MYGNGSVLYVKVLTRVAMNWVQPGYAVAAFSFRLADAPCCECEKVLPAPTVSENRNTVTVSGDGFTYVFRKDEGVLSEWIIGGKSLLARSVEFNCFRAPTDNDNTFQTKRNVYLKWHKTMPFGNID
ncbi:MAG: hypothetical protein IJ439_02900 [Tyzzerella sp.]|nr:hypothetical protein [Tyzzerella sp.]